MRFQTNHTLDFFLNELFGRYRDNVPAVGTITGAMVQLGLVRSQKEIVNDHIAFRTLGVPNLGITSFEKIFLHHGYQKRDNYYFEGKKLNAYWYSPPDPEYPRIFMSELLVEQLSENAQKVIYKYTHGITSDPVNDLDLDNGAAIAAFFNNPLWELPALADYQALLKESEYAAWVIYNRYYLNHYTISVHDLSPGFNTLTEFNRFVEALGVRLNTEGGKIKVSADGLLLQSSTVACMHQATFAGGEQHPVAGSYVEFAERQLHNGQRREGFETANADKIFESTYSKQTHGHSSDH